MTAKCVDASSRLRPGLYAPTYPLYCNTVCRI